MLDVIREIQILVDIGDRLQFEFAFIFQKFNANKSHHRRLRVVRSPCPSPARSPSYGYHSSPAGSACGSVVHQKPIDMLPPQIAHGSEEWSAQEQEDLEDALGKAAREQFPDVKHKWRWISAKVGSKSAKQCAERFNYCRQQAMASSSSSTAKPVSGYPATHSPNRSPTKAGLSGNAANDQVVVSLASESTVRHQGLSMDAGGVDLKGNVFVE